MTAKEEFDLRIDPASCGQCHGEGTIAHRNRWTYGKPVVWCTCPKGIQKYDEALKWAGQQVIGRVSCKKDNL